MSITHLFPPLRKKAEVKLLKPNEPLPSHVGPNEDPNTWSGVGRAWKNLGHEQGFDAPGGSQIRNGGVIAPMSAGIEGALHTGAGAVGGIASRLAEGATKATDSLGLSSGANERAQAMTGVMDNTMLRGAHQVAHPWASQAVSGAPNRAATGPEQGIGGAFGAPMNAGTAGIAGLLGLGAKATDAVGLTNNRSPELMDTASNYWQAAKDSAGAVAQPFAPTEQSARNLKTDPVMTRVSQAGNLATDAANAGLVMRSGIGAGSMIGGELASIPLGLKPRGTPADQVMGRLNDQQRGAVQAQQQEQMQRYIDQGMTPEQAAYQAQDATYKRLLAGEIDVNGPSPTTLPAGPARTGGTGPVVPSPNAVAPQTDAPSPSPTPAPTPGAPAPVTGQPVRGPAMPPAAPDATATAPAPATPPQQQQGFGQPVRGQNPAHAPQAPAADAAPQYDKSWVDQHQMPPEQFQALSQQIKSPEFQKLPVTAQRSAVQQCVYAGAARDAAEKMAKDPNFNPDQYVGGIIQQAQSKNWSPENIQKMYTNATTEAGLHPQSPDAFAWFSEKWGGLKPMEQIGLLLGGSLIIGGIAAAIFGDNAWPGLLMGLLGVGAMAGSAYSAGWLDPILKQLGIGGGGESGTEGAGPNLGEANGTPPPADPAAPAAGTPPVPAGAPPAPGTPPGPNPAPGAASGPPGAPSAAPQPTGAAMGQPTPAPGPAPEDPKAIWPHYSEVINKLPPAEAAKLNQQFGGAAGQKGVIDTGADVKALVTHWAQNPAMDAEAMQLVSAMSPADRAAVVKQLANVGWLDRAALALKPGGPGRLDKMIQMIQSIK